MGEGDGMLALYSLEVAEARLTYLHGMQVGVGWLAHCQLNGSDAQTPDICLEIVAALLNDFRAHPVRCANEGVLLGHCGRQLARDAKVGELDVA